MRETQGRLPEQKSILRKKLSGLLAGEFTGDPADRAKNRAMLDTLLNLPEFIAADCVFTYVSIPREPDTREFISRAIALGKRVAVPLCRKGGEMEARLIGGFDDLVSVGSFGISEPGESCRRVYPDGIDLAVVPGAAFTEEGCRLGHGGGYYDRFLAAYGGFSVGLCREAFILPVLPVEDHDRKVSAVLTERRLIRI